MRISLVSHGFPPHERTGVENYTEALARALARAGHTVSVFAPRRKPELPNYSVRREMRGSYSVHWITTNSAPEDLRESVLLTAVAERFGEYLDHERPEVVHFQHFLKLGLGLVGEARERGIPTVYTAHDYYAVCHRYTLLRPDLEHCEVRGDALACSLCDLALSFLNSMPRFGDYQVGVSPEQLEPADREVLASILDDDEEDTPFGREDFDAAFDLRLELDGLRAEAFTALDRILAPTEFLAGELKRGGVDPAKLSVLGYGIENTDLVGIGPIRPDPDAPVRFGFFGGIGKHKGLGVLIEAFGALDVPAELSIWGYSSDRVHLDEMREAASAAGALWRGPYQRDALPELLAQVDVVVVPSTWAENQPLVIREAFSARRPVITSRFGAMPESVRDGVDGLLFEVGDAVDLTRAMRRLVTDPELLTSLAGGVGVIKSSSDQATELLEIYSELREARSDRGRRETQADLPPSVRPFAARVEELEGLSTRGLFERALRGLDGLRAGLGGKSAALTPAEFLGEALGAGSLARVALTDAKNENAWLAETVEKKDEELGARKDEIAELEAHTQELDRTVDTLRQEGQWLNSVIEGKEEEVRWLREQIDEYSRGRQELERLNEKVQSELERIGQERHAAEAELKNVADLAAITLEAERQLLISEIAPTLEHLNHLLGIGEEGVPDPPAEGEPAVFDLLRRARASRERIATLEKEIAWRRSEMGAAIEGTKKTLAKLLVMRTGVGRRLRGWESGLDGGGVQ